MLRAGVIGCAALALAWTVAAMLWTGLPLWGSAFLLSILVVLLVAERVRYKPLADDAPPPPFQATNERFVDPETGAMVRVWFDPGTGERRYVAERRPAGD